MKHNETNLHYVSNEGFTFQQFPDFLYAAIPWHPICSNSQTGLAIHMARWSNICRNSKGVQPASARLAMSAALSKLLMVQRKFDTTAVLHPKLFLTTAALHPQLLLTTAAPDCSCSPPELLLTAAALHPELLFSTAALTASYSLSISIRSLVS